MAVGDGTLRVTRHWFDGASVTAEGVGCGEVAYGDDRGWAFSSIVVARAPCFGARGRAFVGARAWKRLRCEF